jgi:predicted molibdopterin-dependent oxidoreductase YjgC
MNHPDRLTRPLIGGRQTNWEEAIGFIKEELKQFQPEEIAVGISPTLNNESAAAAIRLANGLGTANLSVIGSRADLEAYQPEIGSSLKELESSAVLLIVGDILTRSPVLSKRVNQVKYGKRGNKIIVIDSKASHTSWFATAVAEPLKEFNSAASGTIVIVPSARIKRNDLAVNFARQLAASSPNKKVITYYEQGNVFGCGRIIEDGLPYAELLRQIEAGEIKAMIMLGDDLAASEPALEKKIRHLKLTVLADYFPREQADDTLVTLPLASHLEAGGTFSFPDGRQASVEAVAPKVGMKSVGEIAELLGAGDATLKKREQVPLEPSAVEGFSFDEDYPLANITHFGNNNLVKRFFWYKVNNG